MTYCDGSMVQWFNPWFIEWKSTHRGLESTRVCRLQGEADGIIRDVEMSMTLQRLETGPEWRTANEVAKTFYGKQQLDPAQLVRPAAAGEELEIAGEIAQIQLREIEKELRANVLAIKRNRTNIDARSEPGW